MKDHSNLDDLIIDNMNSKPKSDMKSILTTIILIIIVLIIAIFSTKMLLNEPEKSPLANELNYTQIANPDLQLDANNTTNDDANSSSASIPASTDINTTSDTQTETINSKPADIPDVINQKLKGTTSQSPKASKISENKEANKSINKQNIPKPEAKNETYFVQVGSFTSKPNETFLSAIKNSEYNYQIKTVKKGNITITKFLIGPYYGREKAESALVGIKNSINKSAFLIKQ